MDFYHCQIVEGDLQTKLQRYVSNVAHMQIAGVPDRHEPIPCEIHYAHLFAAIEASGYRGWIGCEYHPRAGTRAGLDWIAPWLAAAPRAI
jgi:hydroxypyruvate isomerase